MRLRFLLQVFPMPYSYGVLPPRHSLGVELIWFTIRFTSHCVRNSKLVPFGQNHPQHGMSLFQPALLPAAHRVAVIDAGTLDPGKRRFPEHSGSPNSEPRSVRMYSNTVAENHKYPKRFSNRSKIRLDSTLWCQRFIRNARNSFSLVKNMVKQRFL